MRFFEDMNIGEVRLSRGHRVTREAMLEFARNYDPQYFHLDQKLAEQSIFGEVIASGIYGAALWRILDHEINGDIRWICGVAWENVRWPKPIRAGDEVRARSETLAKRLSRSDPGRGVVECGYSLLNQRDEQAFVCRSINLIELKGGSSVPQTSKS
jgi:acyl dehydratase